MLKLNSVMIGTSRIKEMAEFYEKVFEKKADMEEGGWYGWNFGPLNFSIGEHSEVKDDAKEPQRIIFNFESSDVKAEFERIKELGANIIKEPYSMEGWDGLIATLADPDGNYFQLMTPWENESK